MKLTLTTLALLIITNGFSQTLIKESEIAKIKTETCALKTGFIMKFTDIYLKNSKFSYPVAETRIRKINNGDNAKYFYQIKPHLQKNSTASVEYSDLIEIIEAFYSLKSEVKNDINKDPDYLEKKFITEEGFQIGYFVTKGKAVWYIKFKKYGSDKTLYINDLEKIESNLTEAKNKIEELRK